jgi:hypothetical protein
MQRATALAILACGLAFAFASAARAADDDAICPDRPGKPYANCTVPAGHWRVETDLYDQSWMGAAAERTTTTLYTTPVLKYGLRDGLDLEAAITPWQTVRTRDRTTGAVTTQRGPGDLTLQAKIALTKSVSLMPSSPPRRRGTAWAPAAGRAACARPSAATWGAASATPSRRSSISCATRRAGACM